MDIKFGVLIEGFRDGIRTPEECIRDITIGKVYPLTTDDDLNVCFIDDANECHYGLGSNSVYHHSLVVVE